jgi:hypothetical protein
MPFYNLTSVDVFVHTVSVTERGAGVIFVDSHMQAVFVFIPHFWLILGPSKVFHDRPEGGIGTPAPRPSTPLQTARPVVPVASPVRFSKKMLLANSI